MPKLTLKKCFYLALICALLLILGLNINDYEGVDMHIGSAGQHQKGKETIDTRQQMKPPLMKAWYFKNVEYNTRAPMIRRNGLEFKSSTLKLLPLHVLQYDRIVQQLIYIPKNYYRIVESGELKTILLPHGLHKWNVKKGRDVFVSDKCPVHTCQITDNMAVASTADMILHKENYKPTGKQHNNPKQISMLFSRVKYVKIPEAINWTATYRRESTIVAPYTKWLYYDDNVQQKFQDRNYAAGKTKKVAWFVSNCNAENARHKYALELQNYIQVDIYGACGRLQCSRSTPDKCHKLLENDYKFYLAFEKCNCRDYITETYLVNALDRGVVPIVMGARREDYEELAPRHSYIHVDSFASPKELADYLNALDADDALYNSYFEWRGTGEFIDTHFWCRVCAMLHYEDEMRQQNVSSQEIRQSGMCTRNAWKKLEKFYPSKPKDGKKKDKWGTIQSLMVDDDPEFSFRKIIY